MSDLLDARIPMVAGGGLSISVRDSYAAADSVLVPILTTGHTHRANDLGNLPAYARIPLLYGGGSVTAAQILAATDTSEATLLALEDGSGTWNWESGNEIEWPGEEGVP